MKLLLYLLYNKTNKLKTIKAYGTDYNTQFKRY